jgi:hypothetical protein
MTRCWVVWLVAIYVSLDVANPMMPGALTFGIDESVEVRQADRFRAHDGAAAPQPSPTAKHLEPLMPAVVARIRALDVPRVRQHRLQDLRPAVAAPTPSLDDD